MTTAPPSDVTHKLSSDERLLNQWHVENFTIYATTRRLFFLKDRRREILDASYGDVRIQPSRRRLTMFLLLGILLMYLGFLTRSFGIIVGILGIICLIVFILHVEKEILFHIAGRRPVVIKQNAESEKIMEAILKYQKESNAVQRRPQADAK